MSAKRISKGDSLLQRVREAGHPLINGRSATFVWQGKARPSLISDLHGWEANPRPFSKAAGTVWTINIDLPEDAYLEYDFLDQQTGERLGDPLNPDRVFNGIKHYNHYFYMPGARPTPYARAPKNSLRGKITRHTVEDTMRFTVSKQRRIYLYHPPVETAVPLLVVYDGLDYFRRGRLAQIVDNLIEEERIRPLAVAFLQNGGMRGRMAEYACSESTLIFLQHFVIPFVESEIDLLDPTLQPGAYGVLGASMGGLMALYTSLRAPSHFGKALCQAGAYMFNDYETVVMDMVRNLPKSDIHLCLDCGKMDFLLPANRQMVNLLEESGYNVTYRENGGAHNYTTWRNACVDGLIELFAN